MDDELNSGGSGTRGGHGATGIIMTLGGQVLGMEWWAFGFFEVPFCVLWGASSVMCCMTDPPGRVPQHH